MAQTFMWDGFPGARKPVLLPSSVSDILLLKNPPGFLVLSEGSLSFNARGCNTPAALTRTNTLGIISSICLYHGHDGYILAAVDTGYLYQVHVGTDSAELVSTSIQVAKVATTPHHTCIMDMQGRVFSKGIPPMVGTLNKCDNFEKVRFTTGFEVVQLVTGGEFSVALVRRREQEVASPDTPDLALVPTQDQDRESCPLGLVIHTPDKKASETEHAKQQKNLAEGHETHVVEKLVEEMVEKPSDEVDGTDIENVVVDCNVNKSSIIEDVEKTLETTNIEQDYKDLADHEGLSCDIIASQDRTDPYANDISDKSEGIKSLIKLEDIFITTGKVSPIGENKELTDKEVGIYSEKHRKEAVKDEVDDASNNKKEVVVGYGTLSYVTGLGKSVWSNSMSLLSLTSHQSSTASSDNTETLEQLDLSGVIRPGVKSSSEPPTLRQDDSSPDLAWPARRLSSSGSSGSRRETDTVERLCKEGARQGSMQVYCWGVGKRGQLGQGDMLARNTPTLVEWPCCATIVKVCTGSQHCLALSDTGTVWGWGDNSEGQAVYTEQLAVVLTPGVVALQAGERGRDIACHGLGSVVLSDKGRVYILGSIGGGNKSRMQVVALADLKLEIDILPTSVWVGGGTLMMSCQRIHPATQALIMAEVTMLAQVEAVLDLLNKMVSPKTGSADQLNFSKVSPELKNVRDSLLSFYNLLTYAVSCSTLSTSLPQSLHTGVYTYLTQVVASLTCVHTAVCDCIAADSLLLDNYQQLLLPHIVQVLLTQFNIPQANIQGQSVLEQLLTLTLKLLNPYLASLMAVQVALGQDYSSPLLLENISFLTSSVRSLEKAMGIADSTRLFWLSAGPRLGHLLLPHRRLVLDSRRQPLTLQGHFSRHWLVLMSDILIDVGYNTVTTHPLETVWLEVPSVVTSNPRYEIVISTPEDTLTLVAPDSAGRTVWVQAFHKCVVETLARRKGGSKYRKFKEKENFTAAPISRTASYTWTKSELRGCKYEGGWLQGKVHGKGKMVYSDGSVHTGLWRGGLRHGRGAWVGADGSKMEGSWGRGKLEGRGKLVDSNGSTYEGNIVDGVPCGHGIRKEGSFMGHGASVYIGAWTKGMKHGYGVLEEIMVGEKYMGMWWEGVKHGRGCVVNSDGVYYEGNFSNNKLCGGGIMLFEDGARYEGDFCGAGEFNGKGTLVAGGKKMVGTFYGNYSESMKFSGEISSLASDVLGHKEPDMKYTVDPDMKWREVFSSMNNMVGGEDNKQVWDKVAIAINQAKTDGRENGTTPHPGLDYLEMIPVAGQQPPLTIEHLAEVENYLLVATSCPLHPLATLTTQLVEAFTASYGGVRSHPTLLPHAVKELESISSRLYTLLRNLFPALPRPDSVLRISGLGAEEITITPTSLLHPLLLPPLHPTIFMLYALRESKSDSVYWERILRWNKHPDETLLIFLDVDQRLYQNQSHSIRDKDRHFLSAINTLQQIKTMFTPKHKLEVVLAMFKAITGTSTSITWSMDTLLPVCMYVVVRARVLQLGAELAMLQDLMETYLFQGEQGIMLTTLLAAYHQMLKESVFIN